MSRVEISLETSIAKTARAVQISGMFDYKPGEVQTISWVHDLPLDEKPWNVGLIVGPSGSGKSILARELWGDLVRDQHSWDDRSIIDSFPKDVPIAQITGALTAVGFGTVTAWLRPYSTLSNGERFRADMARSLVESTDPIVIDEFTSVVDRQVAKIASHAVQKTIRRDEKRFVAVTCHYDVEDWLQPDWVYDVAAGSFARRLVQPHPALELEIFPASRSVWKVFSRHHYLSADLHSAAQCFIAYVGDRPVAFTSYLHFMHAKTRNIKMGHRLVVLPDYQGLGIAGRLEDWLGQKLHDEGFRYRNVVAHPAMIRLYSHSPRWRDTGRSTTIATSRKSINAKANLSSRRLAVRSFEYTAPKRASS